MAKITSKERVLEYSKEFKVMMVKLSHVEGIQTKQIADSLNLHPLMISRWRKEVRDGKLVAHDLRRIQMTLKNPSHLKKQRATNKKLKQENERLKKENDLLKKWQRYLAEQKENGSDS